MRLAEKELVELYKQNSKHSNYQIIPKALKEILDEGDISQAIARYEQQRFDWLKTQLDFQGKHVLDIGGNTGFFTFESLDEGANKVTYVEGNANHASFVKKGSEILNKNIEVLNKYFDFKSDLEDQKFDIVLLFNVIHHLGDDFGDSSCTMEEAKELMKTSINYFESKTDYLVLQLGFCWKGDRNLLLFENGTKQEMIDFVQDAIKGKWEITQIGIAEEHEGITSYQLANESNLERSDAMGEFRNRPIFILKSLS
ncbi:class I SAM-dependent methyltransferase [Algoriphagus pacificus]|uniref:Methyltransferase domain-containing protein n=1 Tax=Algoriphagus pacificus TaxID=2811234 RepID=A0ABS3CKG9_9BACT|nr:class I SAM-dependent methyltransferase [Algoriphagus pacificus]MBN7817587.1 methyltransferase domain-containing protein [Algoriphagus pacificus]